MKNAVVFTGVDGLIYWMIPPSDSLIIKPVHGPFPSEAAAREDIAKFTDAPSI